MWILPAATPPVSDQTMWLIVGVVGMIALYLIMRPKKRKDPFSGVPTFPLARQRGVEEQMSNLLLELSEMARQITAQLDTRAAKLELLIKEADEKIAGLYAATHSSTPPASDRAIPVTAREVDPSEHSSLADAATTPDPRHADVYALADEGRSPQEIARLLGRPAGEIELILALRPKRV